MEEVPTVAGEEPWPEPLQEGEGAIEALPGAVYVSRALPPTFSYRLSRHVLRAPPSTTAPLSDDEIPAGQEGGSETSQVWHHRQGWPQGPPLQPERFPPRSSNGSALPLTPMS
jgi:hypothetical protein